VTPPQVGATMPVLERAITLPQMVVYAGATWDWYRMHYDEAFCRAKQLPAPVVDGQAFGALFVKQLQDWLGPWCFVHTLEFRYRNLMYADETVRITGEVTAVEDARVDVAMTATILASERGDERPAVSPATALVLLGQADGPRSRRSHPAAATGGSASSGRDDR
jgi:acyl dehydratase